MAIVLRKSKKKGVRYRVIVRDHAGKYFPQESFSTKAEAERYERQLLVGKDLGKQSLPSSVRAMKLQDYWPIWAQECRSRVSDGWRKDQDHMWVHHIAPTLGHLKISEIRSQQIGTLLNALETEKALGAQTRLHIYNLLHKMFDDAAEHFEILEKNPVVRRVKPSVTVVKRNYLPPTEARQLLVQAAEHYLGPAIWLGILAGMRPEAIHPLKVKRLDFDKKQILICEGYKRKVNRVEPYPKGKRWQYVPMPDRLAAYLKIRTGGKAPDDYVISGQRGGMVSYHSLLDGLKRLCLEAGVTLVTPHELRHSASELWVQDGGANKEDIRRLLGQKDIATTERYMHESDEKLRQIAKEVGAVSEPVSGASRPGPGSGDPKRAYLRVIR